MTSLAESIANGLQARFTQMAESLDRLAALEEREPGGGIARLRDPVTTEETAHYLVLGAHRIMGEPANFALLLAIAAEAVPVEVLRFRHHWPLIETAERIQNLARAGLLTYDIEGDRAQVTPAGDALVRELQDEVTELAQRIRQWLVQRPEAGG